MSFLEKNYDHLLKKVGGNTKRLSDEINESQSTIQRIQKGTIKAPSVYIVKRIADYFGYTVDDMCFTDLSSHIEDQEKISIPHLGVTFSLGEGCVRPESDIIVDTVSLSEHFVMQKLRPTNPENLHFATAYGDSMKPTLCDGDVVLIDTGIRTIEIDGVYALASNDELFIKRVTRDMDGGCTISSDNPAVKTTKILNGDSQIEILGRVLRTWNCKAL